MLSSALTSESFKKKKKKFSPRIPQACTEKYSKGSSQLLKPSTEFPSLLLGLPWPWTQAKASCGRPEIAILQAERKYGHFYLYGENGKQNSDIS